jgi:peptide/nickel transport system permease protein
VLRYTGKRTAHAVIVLFGVSVVVFIMIHMLPGGPARALLGPRATPAKVAAFNQQYGYDKPLIIQYFTWLWQTAQGKLGFSVKLNENVTTAIGARLPGTVLLVGLANLLAFAVAVPVGLVQAARRNKVFDYSATGLAFLFYSMPPFWLGLIFVILLSQQLHLLPPIVPQASFGQLLTHPGDIALPVLTLTLVTTALFSRYMRSSALENLPLDYVRTARAKGMGGQQVLWRHVLRNAASPLITLAGLTLPVVVGGAVIVESVFNYPGMGLLFWNAAETQDYPVILGVTLVLSVATALGSFIADILYAVADPRVRLT